MKARVIALALAGVYLVVVACAGEATVEPTPTSTETPTLVPSATLIPVGTPTPTPLAKPTTTPTEPSAPIESATVVPAPIESVAINLDDARSTPSFLEVVSGLRDTCESFKDSSLSRDGDSFIVEVTNSRQVGQNIACAEIYRTVNTRIPTGIEVEVCKVYDVVVNGEPHRVQVIAPNVRCADPDQPVVKPSPTAPVTSEPTSTKEPIGGLCIPPVPLGAAVGDSWTLSGPVKLEGNHPVEIIQDSAEISNTFTVKAIEGSTWRPGGKDTFIENSKLQVLVRSVTREANGNVLATEEDEETRATIYVINPTPLLTPDWDCHSKA